MSALLYDRSNPAATAPGAYASGVQQGGLYAIALAPDTSTPPSAVVEFPYRLVADLGRVRYYALDPSAARDADEAAFLRAYAAEPGVTGRFVTNAYTLAVEARVAPDGTVHLMARPHPAGASLDGRFYISASTDVDTVRRIGAVIQPADLAGPTAIAALVPAGAATRPIQEAPPPTLTLDQLRQADAALKAQRAPAWIRERQSAPGRGRITGGRADVGGVGGVRTQRAETEVQPPQGPEALALYKRRRARQLAQSVLWVQTRQQRQAQLADQALDKARARASQEARTRAQAEIEAQGIALTMPPTRLAARVRHRQAEIAQALVDQAAVDAIQREAAARAQTETEAAIAEQVEREVASGLFHTVPGGGGHTSGVVSRQRRREAGATQTTTTTTTSTATTGPTVATVPPQINVQPQPPAADTAQASAGAGARNRRHSNAAVRAAAMSVFQDTVAQRLSHLPDDSPVIRDIIAEWSAATKSNPAGLTGAMARERAIQWWASQRWADAHPAERARHAEEAKARADSDAVAMAEAAVRRRLEEAAIEAVEPVASAAAAARSRRRRAEQRSEEALLPEPQQALLEAERMAKRARREPLAAMGPPPLVVRTATGQLVEVPRPALASVPVPVASTGAAPAGSSQAAAGTGPSRASLSVGLGVSRSSVAGGGFLGRAPTAPSPVEAAIAAGTVRSPTGALGAPTSSVGDVAARLRQLGLAQAQRAALIQRQTGLQWIQGM